MTAARSLVLVLLLAISTHLCTSDEGKETEDDRKSFGDAIGESMQGMNKWFQGMADDARKTAESGVDSLKEISSDVKDKSDDGMDMAKGWAGGIGDSFSKAKDRMMETGEKMTKTIGDAATNTKEEIETAASKLSKQAKDASDAVFKMFG